MREWKNPTIVDLGLEETKAGDHVHFLNDSSSDSSKNGSSSCSSDCPGRDS